MILVQLDSCVYIAFLQKLAGHAYVQTAAQYDRRGDETRRPAVRQLDISRRNPAMDTGMGLGSARRA